MRDITNLTVSQTRLYLSDVIPFYEFFSVSNLSIITNPFSFREIVPEDDNNQSILGIKMSSGEYKDGNVIYPILSLSIQPRKISFQINSDSSIASKFFNELSALIGKIDKCGRFAKEKILVETTETNCVATLDINYEAIFSKNMRTFINRKALKTVSSAYENVADVFIMPRSLAFNVSYQIKDPVLAQNNMTITTKPLIIEPRANTGQSEKRFFTASPTDSETHLILIGEFEKLF